MTKKHTASHRSGVCDDSSLADLKTSVISDDNTEIILNYMFIDHCAQKMLFRAKICNLN